MSADQLVQELEHLGVHLWEDAGNLRFRAPSGVMTGERRDRLRQEKEAVLLHLRQSAAHIVATADPAHRGDPFPLTDLQGAYLVGRRPSVAFGGVACHAYGELTLGDVDPVRLQAAWDRLVRRHDMLHAIIEPDGSQRVVSEPPPYTIPVVDCAERDPAAVQTEVEHVRADLDHKIHPLGAWPMFDLALTRAGRQSVLHLSIDSLIADFVSVQVLLGELLVLCRDPETVLPPLDITFREYLLAERKVRNGSHYDRDRAYWWARLDTLPPRPELPGRAGVAAETSHVRFTRRSLRLDAREHAQLHARAQASELTLSSALLAAYTDVVARWSRHPRFSLCVTVLRRLPLHPQVNHLIGDFTSVNLLAVDATPQASFRTRAHALQAQLWEDLDHGLCSGVEVLREMTRRRGVGTALMPIVYTNATGLGQQDGTSPGFDVSEHLTYGISQTPQVWIDCQVTQRGDALILDWDVRDGVFPAGVIDAMFEAFATLVAALARDDAAWDAPSPVDVPAHEIAERRRVNATEAPLSDDLLHEGFLAQAARTPLRTAVITDERSLTYGELLARAQTVAHRLTDAGCRPRDLVAVWMPKGLDQVVAVLGTLLAGAAYVPVDTDQPPARRAQMLATARVRHLLTTRALAGDDAATDAERIEVDTLDPLTTVSPRETGSRPATRPTAADDLAYVIYTSGSTGVPKGVMISHRGALNTIADINRRFTVTEDDRVLGLAQLGFDLSVYDIFGPLSVGAALVIPSATERANPAHWALAVATHGVTIWNSVPAQLQMLREYLASEPMALSSLRLAMLSGDWIPTSLPAQILDHVPSFALVSLGGATEASIWSIVYPIAHVAPEWTSIPYGVPLTNQTFHVLDASWRDCPQWVAGELFIGGAGLAIGYLADEEKTAERFVTHPVTGERLYRTGDLGRYVPDGVIEFLGREDSQIKIRGHRIEVAEVETALHARDETARAAVVVHGDEPRERRLAAFVETTKRLLANGDTSARQLGEAVSARVGDLDPDACQDVVRFSRQLDRTALVAMLLALVEQGLFATRDDRHTLTDIQSIARVAPKHHRLVRRWLHALERHQFLVRDAETGRYARCTDVSREMLDDAWQRVEQQQEHFERHSELIDYFRLTSQHLPELLRGELDPVHLLFPQGRVEIHEAAYTDNFLSRYNNRLVTLAVAAIADAHALPCPFRVLEVGAGVGGTSVALIPSLADRQVAYSFTDVSPFFLNNARERFKDFPWVTYGLFDLNRGYRSQGLTSNSFDVIVCANVLHYARNAATALDRIRELLRPDGWLVFIDMNRDSYQVLTSMEFLFDATVTEFEDVRARHDATFISRDQWDTLLREAGAEIALCRPEPDHVLAEVGFQVVAARFKHDRTPLCPQQIERSLAERLPDYMIPQHVQLVDALPITDNGKIDRTTLRSWIPVVEHASSGADVEQPVNELESRLADVWRRVLGVERVGRHQNFFELGGDSLLATQLVGRLREDIVEASTIFFDTLLRLVLDGPTIATLATHLSAPATAQGDGASQSTPRSPLVSLPGREDGLLRVLVHDASGTLAAYANLLDDLGRDGRLAGLVVSDETFLATQAALAIPRAASRYARALLAALGQDARDGPVCLIGHDVGGLLATEVARHLAETGTTDVSLTIINGLPPPYLIDDELFGEYLFIRQAGVAPVKLGYPAEEAVARAIGVILADSPDRIPEGRLSTLGGDADLEAVAWCFRRLMARSDEDRMAAIGRHVARSAAAAAPAEQVRALYEIFRQSLRAAALHEMAPYAGEITLVRATAETPLTRGYAERVATFWQGVCLGQVTIVDVATTVWDCLRPPVNADLVNALRGAGRSAMDTAP